MTEYDEYVEKEMYRINKQLISGYLSKKKIINMQPTELLENIKLLDNEVERRKLGMLFGV